MSYAHALYAFHSRLLNTPSALGWGAILDDAQWFNRLCSFLWTTIVLLKPQGNAGLADHSGLEPDATDRGQKTEDHA